MGLSVCCSHAVRAVPHCGKRHSSVWVFGAGLQAGGWILSLAEFWP
jgi:hypothetical protein